MAFSARMRDSRIDPSIATSSHRPQFDDHSPISTKHSRLADYSRRRLQSVTIGDYTLIGGDRNQLHPFSVGVRGPRNHAGVLRRYLLRGPVLKSLCCKNG
ncbi:hypothetical protein NE237_013514 [Protea cynaroides]|uniref:Uncharacterized protein n=1 Tax=Protea cynaroides TaxID=273540 RepID=A0A9Q0JYL4_9MAGN|nr:hypothetical protein NE237_013514 [Protea cynaroides]